MAHHSRGHARLPAGRGSLEAGAWPHAVRIGRNGFSARRHEGDRTTPAGSFGFVYGFGSHRNPGMRGFGWRPLAPGSCWSGRRADDNRWVAGRRCTAHDENLWASRRVAYRYAAVIDFNYQRPVYGRGSGISLHEQTGGPTAGCVSLREVDLVAVLRWLRPGARIVMGPSGNLARLEPSPRPRASDRRLSGRPADAGQRCRRRSHLRRRSPCG
jgi:L,D-peptidoglycan transpeptidase YkuD (ErfK/YbiS/YcfS/YnhG family)